MPELRKDPLRARWVVIATDRVRPLKAYRHPPPATQPAPCALCPGHEHETPSEVLAYRDAPTGSPNTPGWRVRAVPARFPVLRPDGDLERHGHGLYDLMTGIGAHEIIVESPDHHEDLGQLPATGVEDVILAYRDRIMDIKRDPRMRAVSIFKTHRGGPGGAREHPYSELLATPILPSGLAEEMEQTRAYHEYRERCLCCDIVRQEVEADVRIVAAGEHVVALAPFASCVPFEIWLLPRRHAAGFETAWATEHRDLARVLRDVLGRLARVLDDPPYTMRLHSAPFAESESPAYHWHLEISPQLPQGEPPARTGLPENPLPPEDAARALRDALA